jgi:hypothetical protein
MLDASPEVEVIRELVGKRLMHGKHLENAQKSLDRMLLTLRSAGYVTLEPEPPKPQAEDGEPSPSDQEDESQAEPYRARLAHPTDAMQRLLTFRAVNPLYGVFLINHLGIADRAERIQAMESVLELPRSVGRFVRVPDQEELPPGPLATSRLDVQLLSLGLVTPEELAASEEEEDEHPRRRAFYEEEKPRVLTLAEKLRMLFDYDFPGVHDVRTEGVWAAGELLEYGGDFNKFVTSKRLQKQEGILFRHLLRLILLIQEFEALCPPDTTEDEWRTDLDEIANCITECCRSVDPSSTDEMLQHARQSFEL